MRVPRARPSSALGLANAEVVDARAEELGRRGSGRYDVVTARALAPPRRPASSTPRRCSREGGVLVAWKGRRDRGRGGRRRARGGDPRHERPEPRARRPVPARRRPAPLPQPRRSRPTPAGYPRRPGMARKRPLGALESSLSDGSAPNRRLAAPTEPAASFGRSHGHRLRDREPEGRGRQDDDRRQRRRLRRRGRLPDAARRPRPAGATPPSALGLPKDREPSVYDCLAGDVSVAEALVADRTSTNLWLVPAHPRPRRRHRRAAARSPAPRRACATRSARCASASPSSLLDCPPSLGPLTRQRAGRRRPGDRPGPDRVLRARGPRRSPRHAGADPARAEPAPDGRRACC